MDTINLAIFASGSGSNAEAIIRYFWDKPGVKVAVVCCNKPGALVLNRAEQLGVPTLLFSRGEFYQTDSVLSSLSRYQVHWVILAGFLWLVPDNLIKTYSDRIINIHPALLPDYGGKGMYGQRVHQTIIDNREKESGITIHYVNNEYDRGEIIFQASCQVEEGETADSLADKIHRLEHRYYPEVIWKLIKSHSL